PTSWTGPLGHPIGEQVDDETLGRAYSGGPGPLPARKGGLEERQPDRGAGAAEDGTSVHLPRPSHGVPPLFWNAWLVATRVSRSLKWAPCFENAAVSASIAWRSPSSVGSLPNAYWNTLLAKQDRKRGSFLIA